MIDSRKIVLVMRVLIGLSALGFVSHFGALINTAWMKSVSGAYDDDSSNIIKHLGIFQICESRGPDLGCVRLANKFQGLGKSDMYSVQALAILSLMCCTCGLILRGVALKRTQAPLWRISAFGCSFLEALMSITSLALFRNLLFASGMANNFIYAIGFMAPAAVIVLALLVMVISFFTFNPGLQACSHITESDCTANTMHMPLTGPYRDGESGYQ